MNLKLKNPAQNVSNDVNKRHLNNKINAFKSNINVVPHFSVSCSYSEFRAIILFYLAIILNLEFKRKINPRFKNIKPTPNFAACSTQEKLKILF